MRRFDLTSLRSTFRRVRAVEDRVAHLAREPVQDRGLDEEIEGVVVKRGEKLVPHVVGNERSSP